MRKAKNSPNTLQIISAFLYFGILMIQVNRETRKILQLRKGRFTIQNVLNLMGTIRSLRIIRI